MSSTATAASGVDDLGPEALLAAVRDNARVRREADLRQLQLAYQWCVLHPATADTGVAVWGGDGDLDADESLGGDGTPMVAAFAPEPFGLALGVSTDTAKTLLADALDLVHRLPHTWRRLQTLDVPVWRGRRLGCRRDGSNHRLGRGSTARDGHCRGSSGCSRRSSHRSDARGGTRRRRRGPANDARRGGFFPLDRRRRFGRATLRPGAGAALDHRRVDALLGGFLATLPFQMTLHTVDLLGEHGRKRGEPLMGRELVH